MMHMVDDFRAFPRVEYEMTLKHSGCWAGALAISSGAEIAIDPIVHKGKALVVLVAVPLHASPVEALAKLRKKGAIRNYAELQRAMRNFVFQVEVPRHDSIIMSMTSLAFELLAPVIVKGETEVYRFGTLDVNHAEPLFRTLLDRLKRMREVSIIDYRVKKIEQATVAEKMRWSEKDRELIRELVLTDYFNPSKTGRPTQDELAAKLHVAAGKLNRMLRRIEHIGFQNLLALRPDLEEFRALLREVEEEELSK